MMDEFSFIKRITPNKNFQRSLIVGIGDDAAVYRSKAGFDEVICVDTMVEDIHFRLDTLTPFQIGYKALAVNVSDIAAMGAIPTYYLVSIAVPKHWQEESVVEIYAGMKQLAEQYSLNLIGGDTVSTNDKLVITVTALGQVEQGEQLQRSMAQDGDIVFVTGTVGDSAAGLHLLFEKGLDGPYHAGEQVLVATHQQPKPQVEFARMLINHHIRVSLNDVSDGVASEVNELAEASQVTIRLHVNQLPLSDAMQMFPREKQIEWALYGGEDFQLIGTVAKEDWQRLLEQCHLLGIRCTNIGVVEAGDAKVLLVEDEQVTELKVFGYNHFRK